MSQFWQRHFALIALRSRTAPSLEDSADFATQIVVTWKSESGDEIVMRIMEFYENEMKTLSDFEIVEERNNYYQCFYKSHNDDKKVNILSIDINDNCFIFYPKNTIPSSSNYLKQKYDKIYTIVLYSDFTSWKNINIETLLQKLEELPRGFIKDYSYGFGLLKDYRFVIHEIESQLDVKCIIFTDNKTEYNENAFIFNLDDFDTIRRMIDRINDKHQENSRNEKQISTYNALFPNLPPKKEEYKEDVIYKFLRNKKSPEGISIKDQQVLLDYLVISAEDIIKNKPQALSELKEEIDAYGIIYFKELFEKLYNENAKENRWQALLNEHSYIFTLIVGSPVINLYEQVPVGGRDLEGKNTSIVDFLNKNPFTNNLSIIEIKTPKKKLLNKTEYRHSVYSPSNELAGSINQLLDQKNKLQKEITTLKVNSGVYDIETYHIECLLIIGLTPESDAEKKSFELFRHAIKDIKIITFDELLDIIKNIVLIIENAKRE